MSAAIEVKEQKSADTSQFLDIVRKYTEITEGTPEIIHKLIEKIAVHAPDKSIGHRVQQIDIYYRFLHLLLTSGSMTKGERLRRVSRQPFQKQRNTSLSSPNFRNGIFILIDQPNRSISESSLWDCSPTVTIFS